MARAIRKATIPAARKTSSPVASPPAFAEPQLAKLVETAPTGAQWVHEIKYDGYRMAARIEAGKVRLLTRSGLDWTAKYPQTAAALSKLPAKSAYLDGELCGVREDGVTSFAMMQAASDAGAASLVFNALRPAIPRRPLAPSRAPAGPQGGPRQGAQGRAARAHVQRAPGRRRRAHPRRGLQARARRLGVKAHRPPIPARQPRRLGEVEVPRPRRVRCRRLDRSRGLATPSRRPAARLLRAGRQAGLRRPGRHRHVGRGPEDAARPPRPARRRENADRRAAAAKEPLGSPLALSRVHLVEPKLVVEITYLTWTADNLLRHTVFVGLREDKPAAQVHRELPDAGG